MSLFKSLKEPDRQQTQLAYKVRCYPWQHVPATGKELVAFHKELYMPKQRIISLLNEDSTTLHIDKTSWTIVWAYCCIPTEQEWERKSNSYLVSVDLRVSPAIPEGKVAILNFELPSSLNLATIHNILESEAHNVY